MEWQGCEPELRRAFADGRRAHGDLGVDFADFAQHFIRLTLHRLGEAPSPSDDASVRDTLRRAAGGDVYLALACERGSEEAWAVLMTIRPRVVAILTKRGARRDEAEAVVDEVWGQLALRPQHGRTRTNIGSFSGTASLFYWLRGVAVRRWADMLRARRREEPLPEEGEGAPAAAREADETPGSEAAETAHRALRALAAARAAMTPNQAACLVWKHHRGMQQKHIARLLGVGAPRVARILKAARAKLEQALRAEFGDHLDLERIAEALGRWLERLDAERPPDTDDTGAPAP